MITEHWLLANYSLSDSYFLSMIDSHSNELKNIQDGAKAQVWYVWCAWKSLLENFIPISSRFFPRFTNFSELWEKGENSLCKTKLYSHFFLFQVSSLNKFFPSLIIDSQGLLKSRTKERLDFSHHLSHDLILPHVEFSPLLQLWLPLY